MNKTKPEIAVVIPNWNGEQYLQECLDSLKTQSQSIQIIVVDNGSVDNSKEIIRANTDVVLIEHTENKGFAGGVNAGIRYAIENKFKYVMLFNNDAKADQNAIKELANYLDENDEVGICAPKLLSFDGSKLDSSGDFYSTWGLPFPRGRGSTEINKYDDQTDIFAGTGGASMYRIKMIEVIGLFDEDFFAYYEDVDISFRAQLEGWKVRYVPSSIVYHRIGGTSSKIKGFQTYQTFKNLPWLMIKNVPSPLIWKVFPRLIIAELTFFLSALIRFQGWHAIKGDFASGKKLKKKLAERKEIQANKTIGNEELLAMLYKDIPESNKKLRKLRNTIIFWRKYE